MHSRLTDLPPNKPGSRTSSDGTVAENDWGGPTVTEFWGSHSMEEGKAERYLALGRQYGNAVLGVRHQEEDCAVSELLIFTMGGKAKWLVYLLNHQVTTPGKLFTHMCFCHQAVSFGTDLNAGKVTAVCGRGVTDHPHN